MKRFGLFLGTFALFAGLISTAPAAANSDPNTMPKSSPSSNPDAVKSAMAHLISNAVEWEIDLKQFQPDAVINGVAGMSVVRFVQSIAGIEVANSLLAVTVNNDGSLLSYTKSISDYSGTSQSVISEVLATELLKSKLAQTNSTLPENVIVSEIKLVIVDSALVNDVPSGKYLAWRAATSILNNATSISTTYLSRDGKRVLSSLPFVRGITADPFVCDLQVDIATPGYVLPAGVTVDVNNNRYVNISAGDRVMPYVELTLLD